MAELLYRLGRFSARRAWVVLVSWLAILAIAVVGFVIGFKPLASSFDIPGTASGQVTDELAAKLPDLAGASGQVVFSTPDGEAFTADQKKQISALVDGAGDLPDVSDVVDPFDTEKERADQATELDDAVTKLDDAQKQIDDGEAQIADGLDQLDAAQTQLDAAREQAEAAGYPTDQIDAQQKTLDENRAELKKQKAKLADSQDELDANRTKTELGQKLLSYAEGIRTVSKDGSAAIVNVAFDLARLELPESSKQAVIDYFDGTPIDGVEVAFSTDIAQGVPSIFGVGEAVGLVVAAVVLLVMLGSIVAAVLPLVTAILGVGVGVVGSMAFSGIVDMTSVTPVLGVMLGLAVGIDYALFIINRHRKQLRAGMPVHESIGLANGTAGNAVVFAGTTVIVALLALNITGVPFLGVMGTVGAVCVAIAVLMAITMTPALLGMAGEKLLTRRARAKRAAVIAEHERVNAAAPAAPAVKPMSTWRAALTAVGAVVALLVVAIPALSMRVGLPDGSTEPEGSASYRAFMVVDDEFGAGANGALLVSASLPAGLDDDGVLQAQVDVASTLMNQKDVVAVAPIAVSDDNRLAAFQVIPADGPSSESTEQLVRDLRALEPVDGDITLGVAGQASINIDISENLLDVLPIYLAVVIGLSLLIMICVFRSLLVPLIATGGFVLSLFATFGALTAVFQWGWLADVLGIHSTGPILSFLPVILVGILFGLAMDYQLFLASGMREAYVHGASARVAVQRGFHAGRAVVTAAGLIMVSVFGGFVFSESTMIRSIGFGLAFGVLVDAFVVRMLLMPALMHLIGRGAWWLPKWLDRIIPNVDVEGAALERRHHVV